MNNLEEMRKLMELIKQSEDKGTDLDAVALDYLLSAKSALSAAQKFLKDSNLQTTAEGLSSILGKLINALDKNSMHGLETNENKNIQMISSRLKVGLKQKLTSQPSQAKSGRL